MFRSTLLILTLAVTFAVLTGCRGGLGVSSTPPADADPQSDLAAAESPEGEAEAGPGTAHYEVAGREITPDIDAAEPIDASKLEESMHRGIAFLLEAQNSDGSWGAPTRTKGSNIYAPVPGAHQAFRAAVTSLVIAALVETAPEDADVVAALERAEGWLLEELPRVRRADGRAIYNNWSHAYGIQAAVRLLDWGEQTSERREAITALIEDQIDRLGRYEYIIGGWGYYDFNAQTQRPSGNVTSFTTATALVALHEAEQAGIDVPADMAERAVEAVLRQRNPDNTYVYSSNFQNYRGREVNRPPGSLARSQVCNIALRMWGEGEKITDAVLVKWLDRLFARNGWLDIGRKRPVPHETWYAVAGYFYYYGHYYAAYVIEALPDDIRPFYQAHMSRTLVALQEDDGSWWDFPLYDYHQPYGTAMALMALQRSRIDA